MLLTTLLILLTLSAKGLCEDAPPGFKALVYCNNVIKSKAHTRLSSTHKSSMEEFPFSVYLYHTDKLKKWCGGILITEIYILMTANCIKQINPNRARFQYDKIEFNNSSNFQEFEVSDQAIHPKYNRTISHYHDIGLVKLKQPIKFTGEMYPACVQVYKRIKEPKLYISTWNNKGWTESYKRQYKLEKVNVSEAYGDECYDLYGATPDHMLPSGLVDHLQMCINEGNVNSQNNVPAGLLNLNLNLNTYTVVGVPSIGIKDRRRPQVYTRVSSYIKWIEEVVWPNYSKRHCSRVYYERNNKENT